MVWCREACRWRQMNDIMHYGRARRLRRLGSHYHRMRSRVPRKRPFLHACRHTRWGGSLWVCKVHLANSMSIQKHRAVVIRRAVRRAVWRALGRETGRVTLRAIRRVIPRTVRWVIWRAIRRIRRTLWQTTCGQPGRLPGGPHAEGYGHQHGWKNGLGVVCVVASMGAYFCVCTIIGCASIHWRLLIRRTNVTRLLREILRAVRRWPRYRHRCRLCVHLLSQCRHIHHRFVLCETVNLIEFARELLHTTHILRSHGSFEAQLKNGSRFVGVLRYESGCWFAWRLRWRC